MIHFLAGLPFAIILIIFAFASVFFFFYFFSRIVDFIALGLLVLILYEISMSIGDYILK